MPKHTESRSQQAVIRWFKFAHKGLGVPDERLLMSIPNGGQRNVVTGAILKAEGCRAGAPDLLLAVPRQSRDKFDEWQCTPGLFIEMKRLTGSLTQSQKEMAQLLSAQNYEVKTCYSTDEAIRTIEAYLKS